jgi:hypothetical protein
MYSDSDLESAIAAGAISAETASALRNHVSGLRHNPAVDEEHFRLVTGFNDIFVSIAGVLMLVGGAWIGGNISAWLGGLAVAGIAWGMAEYFTRVRRMALPSILFMIAFSGGVMSGTLGLLTGNGSVNLDDKTGALVAAVAAAITTGATWLHWRRFKVPITIAVLTAAGVGTVIALIASGLPNPEKWLPWLSFAAGLIVFGLAMKWDSSDTQRQTRKADVAFWLHLLAAPMIVHPLFVQLNIWEGDPNGLQIAAVLAIYVLLALIALLIDRRALMVSGLAYVLTALMQFFSEFGSVGLNVGMAAFVIGSALLLLSAFWHNARAKLLGITPLSMRNWLPAPALSQQPAS